MKILQLVLKKDFIKSNFEYGTFFKLTLETNELVDSIRE